MRSLLTFCFLLALFTPIKAVTKVACIGASITHGAFINDKEHFSFPGQLQTLLGEHYLVSNFGVDGATMLKHGDNPYWKTNEFKNALSSNPDIVFIDLGGNDSNLKNRIYLHEINQDCQDMIDAFRALPSHPRVIVMLPVVSFVRDTTGIWDRSIVRQVIPGLQQAVYEKKAELLDMHPLLVNHEELMPDKIHPNVVGAGIMAKRLYECVLQSRDDRFDIFTKLPQPSVISSFNGYSCADFTFSGRSCKVVKPKVAAAGHPWIWRARFWGHEPQTDIALLERGFHLVYCDVAELFGNQDCINIWNNFYSMLNKAGLSNKAVMEGMSRGGVYVLNWAAVNPKKVACVYIDNPVLDLRSWPGGIGNDYQSPSELKDFMRDYNLKTTEDIKAFKGSPINYVNKIAKGNYPILIVCADADEAVPPKDNTLLFERKMKERNGKISVIHKPGFKHHPHSFPNPEPILNFILNSSGVTR